MLSIGIVPIHQGPFNTLGVDDILELIFLYE